MDDVRGCKVMLASGCELLAFDLHAAMVNNFLVLTLNLVQLRPIVVHCMLHNADPARGLSQQHFERGHSKMQNQNFFPCSFAMIHV
jgi:hypothetical protein